MSTATIILPVLAPIISVVGRIGVRASRSARPAASLRSSSAPKTAKVIPGMPVCSRRLRRDEAKLASPTARAGARGSASAHSMEVTMPRREIRDVVVIAPDLFEIAADLDPDGARLGDQVARSAIECGDFTLLIAQVRANIEQVLG